MSDTAVIESPAPSKAAQKMITDMTILGMEVTEEDKKEIVEFVSDDDLAKAFIEMRLDKSVDPKELKKMSLFSGSLWERVQLNPVLMTMQMMSLGTARRVIDHTENRAKGLEQDGVTPLDYKMSPEADIGNDRLMLLASVEMSKMIIRAQKQAALLQGAPKPKGPKNKPFDSLAPQSTLIQNNAGGTVVLNSPKQT